MILSEFLSRFKKTKPTPSIVVQAPPVDLGPLRAELAQWQASVQASWQQLASSVSKTESRTAEHLHAALEKLMQAETKLKLAASTTGKAEPLALSLAFIQGFQFALGEGSQRLRHEMMESSTNEALKRLDSVVESRAQALGATAPRSFLELQKKREEFQSKLNNSPSPADQAKYTHYLTAIDWALHANGLSTHET